VSNRIAMENHLGSKRGGTKRAEGGGGAGGVLENGTGEDRAWPGAGGVQLEPEDPEAQDPHATRVPQAYSAGRATQQ